MIRPAVQADAAAIAAIWNEVIRSSTTTFTTVEKSHDDMTALIETRICLVAEHRVAVAGFATYGPFRAGPGYRHTAEHSVYLREEARGSALGRALMLALEDTARTSGIRVLVAAIGGENVGAQAFHARLGYRKEGHLTGIGEKFGRSQDLILMTRKL